MSFTEMIKRSAKEQGINGFHLDRAFGEKIDDNKLGALYCFIYHIGDITLTDLFGEYINKPHYGILLIKKDLKFKIFI